MTTSGFPQEAIEIHEVDAAEVKRLWPLAYTDDIIGAIYSPTDGRVEPKETALAIAS